MYILVAYDVETIDREGQKRLRHVAKACKDYGQRVQNSVFECELTQVQLILLQHRLEEIIDKKHDSIRIYKLSKGNDPKVLGRQTAYDFNDTLII